MVTEILEVRSVSVLAIGGFVVEGANLVGNFEGSSGVGISVERVDLRSSSGPGSSVTSFAAMGFCIGGVETWFGI
jgi:hypothetical protein